MRRSVAAELLVLRKRTATWVLLVLWTLLAGLFSYLIPYIQDAPQIPLETLLPESLAGRLISGFPFFGGVFALTLAERVLRLRSGSSVSCRRCSPPRLACSR